MITDYEIRATIEDDWQQLSALLQRVFNVGAEAAFLQRSLMAWKYWNHRGDWTEPRGYVAQAGSSIVAHIGIWPMTIGSGIHARRGVQVLDWAAGKESPGAGSTLLRRLADQFDFVYVVGGSDITRKILPLFGFVEHGQTWRGARPVRAVGQALSHQNRSYKLGARLVRNWVWSTFPRNHAVSGWRVEEISPAQVNDSLIQQGASAAVFSPRTSAFFEYYLRCPLIRFRLYKIENTDGPQGHFAMGVLRGQARIAGVWLRDPSAEAWSAAFSLAQDIAAQQQESKEIAAAGTVGLSGEVAARCGLRQTRTVPVYLLNGKTGVDLPKDFQFQLWDDDEAFFDSGRADYWT